MYHTWRKLWKLKVLRYIRTQSTRKQEQCTIISTPSRHYLHHVTNNASNNPMLSQIHVPVSQPRKRRKQNWKQTQSESPILVWRCKNKRPSIFARTAQILAPTWLSGTRAISKLSMQPKILFFPTNHFIFLMVILAAYASVQTTKGRVFFCVEKETENRKVMLQTHFIKRCPQHEGFCSHQKCFDKCEHKLHEKSLVKQFTFLKTFF